MYPSQIHLVVCRLSSKKPHRDWLSAHILQLSFKYKVSHCFDTFPICSTPFLVPQHLVNWKRPLISTHSVPLYGDTYAVWFTSWVKMSWWTSHHLSFLLSYVYTEHYLAKPLTCVIIFDTRWDGTNLQDHIFMIFVLLWPREHLDFECFQTRTFDEQFSKLPSPLQKGGLGC